ncbi:hypothetical protein [Micromonospora sp. NPDC000668]|uniref:hypothetical protein n=1 Tax=Micromonospora sp. NPDC000668 TaxID=3364219 RepID=UPI0036CF6C02
MDVPELLFHLTRRRRMYLLDDRYLTAVAFVEGFNQALDRRPLNGFQEWLCRRVLGYGTGAHWSYVIDSSEVPGLPPGAVNLNDLGPETQLRLIDRMLALIGEFSEAGEVPGG